MPIGRLKVMTLAENSTITVPDDAGDRPTQVVGLPSHPPLLGSQNISRSEPLLATGNRECGNARVLFDVAVARALTEQQ